MKPAMAGAEMNCGRTRKVGVSSRARASLVQRGPAHLDDPSEAQQADGEDDGAADEGEGGRDDVAGDVGAAGLLLDVLDDLGHLERHDSDRTNRDVLGRGEERVDPAREEPGQPGPTRRPAREKGLDAHDADEGRVQAELGRQRRDLGVRHRLRDDDHADLCASESRRNVSRRSSLLLLLEGKCELSHAP